MRATAIGKLIIEIAKWSDTYEFSFQFWGSGNNNVWVYKGGIELYSTGSHYEPEDALQAAIDYVNKINPNK